MHALRCPTKILPEVLAIVLACAVEYHGSGGHINAHSKGLGSEKYLDQTPAEAYLHDFLRKPETRSCQSISNLDVSVTTATGSIQGSSI